VPATARCVHAVRSNESFPAALARAMRCDEELRAELLDTPEDDPQYGFLAACADRIVPLDVGALPQTFQLPGGLPSFLDPELLNTSFSHRCGPPTTPPLVLPAPVQAPPPELWPNCVQECFPPGYFDAKADPWFARLHTWLLDVMRNGVDGTVARPEPLVFGTSEMYPHCRGVPWDFTSARGRPSDSLERMVDTHLNVSYLQSFADGYPDQEMLGSLVYGVSFKSPLGRESPGAAHVQLVFSAHLESLRAAFPKVQSQLERRAAMGWCGVYRHVPLCHWQMQ